MVFGKISKTLMLLPHIGYSISIDLTEIHESKVENNFSKIMYNKFEISLMEEC